MMMKIITASIASPWSKLIAAAAAKITTNTSINGSKIFFQSGSDLILMMFNPYCFWRRLTSAALSPPARVCSFFSASSAEIV